MRAAATHTPSQTSSPRDAILLGGLQTALCSSLRIGHADGDKEFSQKIQQMIKRTIKTPASGTPVIGIEELDVSTKYDGDSCELSYLSMLVKVFKPLLFEIDSTTSLVASAFVFFALIISAQIECVSSDFLVV